VTNRRTFLALAVGALGTSPRAYAQQGGKPPRVGWLTSSVIHKANVDAFREGMRSVGYPDVTIEFQAAAGESAKLPALAAALVSLKVDVIVTDGAAAAVAAKQATSVIPVVMGAIGDPVADSVVTSLARPGGNITGLSISTGGELHGKRLELLREIVPTVRRLAVIWNPRNPASRRNLTEAETTGHTLSVQILPLEASNQIEIDRAFSAATETRVGALMTLPDAFLWSLRSRIVTLAARHRLPAMYPEPEFVTAGGLIAYGPNVPANFRRAAVYVDKILKGAKPGDLPIEQPTKFELLINLKTAKALGLTIPPALLLRADQVIE
jgi:putative tryptophan/tyrosine transport system substrate-binding protein